MVTKPASYIDDKSLPQMLTSFTPVLYDPLD